MCEHNINKEDCSVILSKRRCMVSPSTYRGICVECGTSFEYILNQDGQYVLKEEEADEDI